jgi:SET domain-containing protein
MALSKRIVKPRPFDVRESDVHGTGVFANRTIRRGERVVEYKGERITAEESDTRYPDPEDTDEPHHTFLFEVDDEIVIDGAVNGNSARFINHSCDPNCEAVDEDGRIFIEALREIQAGEELNYDYGFDLGEPHTKKLKELYPCRCGSENCRGTILIDQPDKKKNKKKKKKDKKKKDKKKKEKK